MAASSDEIFEYVLILPLRVEILALQQLQHPVRDMNGSNLCFYCQRACDVNQKVIEPALEEGIVSQVAEELQDVLEVHFQQLRLKDS